MSDAFWSAARSRMMLEPIVANSNTGSFGPGSRPNFSRKASRCLSNASRTLSDIGTAGLVLPEGCGLFGFFLRRLLGIARLS